MNWMPVRRRWAPWVALVLLGACGGRRELRATVGRAPAPRLRPIAPHTGRTAHAAAPDWFRLVERLADRRSLAASFEAARYTLPPHTFLLAARVVPGVGQPAFQYFSLGDSGFVYSPGRYWPASTVKLMTTVGALWTLHKHGLSGAARVAFTDAEGRYSGTVRELYDKALGLSTNTEYNRLALIAGFDALNEEYLRPETGLPRMVLQRRYGKRIPGATLRVSPEMSFEEGPRRVTLPERAGRGSYPECPQQGNCATLFELLEVLRRVMLHDELPEASRFPLGRADRLRIRALLRGTPEKLEPGASQALEHPVQIYNKAGRYPGDDHLDVALVVDAVTAERFLIAVSVRYGSLKEPDAVSQGHLSDLAHHTLRALARRPRALALPTDRPLVQEAAGETISVHAAQHGADPLRYRLWFEVETVEQLKVWVGPEAPTLLRRTGRGFLLEHRFARSGDLPVALLGLRGEKPVAYRAVELHVP
ncbi:MAG: hypothetical protein IT371_19185 [Deltaproteobacteria bacterium]|nr:hypothetical protein [Deltaproteobacteria bacterium]